MVDKPPSIVSTLTNKKEIIATIITDTIFICLVLGNLLLKFSAKLLAIVATISIDNIPIE